jgi:hypothetical protein
MGLRRALRADADRPRPEGPPVTAVRALAGVPGEGVTEYSALHTRLGWDVVRAIRRPSR